MPEIDCSHPYWGQSIQCRERQAKQQQKPQAKPEAKPQKAQEKPREGKPKKPRDSFDDELANRHVRIVMVAGNGKTEEVSGTIIETSRYWLKVLDDNGTLRYINKAFIITITPQ